MCKLSKCDNEHCSCVVPITDTVCNQCVCRCCLLAHSVDSMAASTRRIPCGVRGPWSGSVLDVCMGSAVSVGRMDMSIMLGTGHTTHTMYANNCMHMFTYMHTCTMHAHDPWRGADPSVPAIRTAIGA